MSLSNKDSIYLKIYNDYKRYIELGAYLYQDKLPSVRNLACDLGINPNTVQRAYQMLEEQGYIETIEKKGVYVCYKKTDIIDEHQLQLKNEMINLKNKGYKYIEILKALEEVFND